MQFSCPFSSGRGIGLLEKPRSEGTARPDDAGPAGLRERTVTRGSGITGFDCGTGGLAGVT